MTLYSYILTYDGGTTPNPFHGTCTLAICKPAIRRNAQLGDWIIATGPKRNPTCKKLIFAMQVTEIVPLEAYFRDKRFKAKEPDMASADAVKRAGDNMYGREKADGPWVRIPGPRVPEVFEKDVAGVNALLSTHFFYFGTKAIDFPTHLQSLIHNNQGHRNSFPEELIQQFTKWLEGAHKPGVHGEPSDPPPERVSA